MSDSAVQQVFETAELLEFIIVELPEWQIARVKLVKKYWLSLIRGSHKIRRARVVSPEESPDIHGDGSPQSWAGMSSVNGVRTVHKIMGDKHSTYFSATNWFRLNPIFPLTDCVYSSDNREGALEKDCVMVKFDTNWHATDEEMEQFVTEPPCNTVELITWADVRWDCNRAWARNRDGLKVKDVLLVADKLRHAQSLIRGPDGEAASFEVVGSFYVVPPAYPGGSIDDQKLNETLRASARGWRQYFKQPLPRFRRITDIPSLESGKRMSRDSELFFWDYHGW